MFYVSLLFRFTLVCVLVMSSATARAESLEKVSLALQWKHQFEFAGFYAAIEQGYYREAGLDVSIIEPDGTLSATEYILEKNVNYAISGSSAVLDYLEGKPIVLLANIFKRSPLAIVAQQELKTPKDLEGRTMMAPLDSGFKEVSLLTMLHRFGVSKEDIKFQTPSFQLKSFLNKEVDSFVIFTTNELYELEHTNYPFSLLDPINYGISDYDVNLITSQEEWLQHPQRTRRFREASLKGWQYALAHPQEVVELILEKYNSQNKTREALSSEARLTHQVIMPELYPIGSIDQQRLLKTGKTLQEIGLLSMAATLDFSDFTPLENAYKNYFNQEEVDYIKQKGAITYCADPNWLPFEKIDGGKLKGMSADFLQLLSKKSGLAFKLVPTQSWSQSIEYAKQRKCDLLSLAMSTPEREIYMNFTTPNFEFPLVLATKSDALYIDDIRNVLDKRIGIVKGYAYYELLKQKYPNFNLVQVENTLDGLERVRRGEVFGFIDSMAVVGYHLQRDYVGELIIAGKFDELWRLGIGVRNDDPVLLGVMQSAVQMVSAEEKRAIYNKWVSVIYQENIDYDWLLKWTVFIGIVFLLLAYLLRVQSRYLKTIELANQEIREKNIQLEKLSNTDKLTQLYNRLRLDEELERKWKLYLRYRRDFSVLLIDIDHFKRINDGYGHLEGDRILQEVASLLRDTVRETDILGRWGGEEFLVICPSTVVDGAEQLAEQLCSKVAQAELGLESPVTISVGVTQTSKAVQSLEAVLHAADKALYDAKSQGRNRVVLHTFDPGHQD